MELYVVIQREFTIKICRCFCVCLKYLRFFTCVSWGILPSANLIDCADNGYMSVRFFLSPLFLYFFILEFKNLFLSVLFCVLFCSLSCSSFYSFLLFFLFLSLSVHSFYFLILLIVFFSNLLFFFFLFILLYSACFSLMFYYYSIYSISVILHLFRTLCLILLCYLFCSCSSFIYTPSFW